MVIGTAPTGEGGFARRFDCRMGASAQFTKLATTCTIRQETGSVTNNNGDREPSTTALDIQNIS
jgi:hypothetical protein